MNKFLSICLFRLFGCLFVCLLFLKGENLVLKFVDADMRLETCLKLSRDLNALF
jgi:hypothetical protein